MDIERCKVCCLQECGHSMHWLVMDEGHLCNGVWVLLLQFCLLLLVATLLGSLQPSAMSASLCKHYFCAQSQVRCRNAGMTLPVYGQKRSCKRITAQRL